MKRCIVTIRRGGKVRYLRCNPDGAVAEVKAPTPTAPVVSTPAPAGEKPKAANPIEYVIQGHYGPGTGGWHDENFEDTLTDARRSLREYRANGPGRYRMIKRRVKKTNPRHRRR